MCNRNVISALAKPCPVDNLARGISESLGGWVKRGNVEACLLHRAPSPPPPFPSLHPISSQREAQEDSTCGQRSGGLLAIGP